MSSWNAMRTQSGGTTVCSGLKWISASSTIRMAVTCKPNLPKLDAGKLARPRRPDEVIRHARKDRVLASFADNVWPMRFRCMGCHTEGTPQCDKLVKEHGERVAWFKKDGPETTLDYLRAS